MRRILIVDDEYAIVDLLEDLLASEGYAVASARDGRRGLQAVASHRPHLVLLDIMMPVLSGTEMLAAMRADPSMAQTPVLLMSAGSTLPALDERTVFVTKPFDIFQLLELVDDLVARSW